MEITEQPGPATAALDRLSTEEIVALINTEDAAVAAAVRTALPEIARTVDLIADRLRHAPCKRPESWARPPSRSSATAALPSLISPISPWSP